MSTPHPTPAVEPAECSARTETLSRIASTLASVGTIDELLASLVGLMDDVIFAEYLAFYRYDEAQDRLLLSGWKGLSEHEAQYAEMSAMHRHPGRVWRTGEAVLVQDTLLDPRGTSDSPRREQMRSRFYLPVVGRDKTLGVFGLASPRPNAFAAESVSALEFVSAVAGAVWERLIATESRAGLERQLQQSQKMEVVGRLVSSIAHDFNNVLTVLLAQGGRIEQRGESPESVADAIVIQETCDRAAELTRRLLTFSRPGSGEAGVLLLDEELRRYETILARLIPQSVELQITHPTRALGVEIAASELEQVLLNLVVNARDAMPRGGLLRVEVSERADSSRDRWVVLTVADNGAGMDEAVSSRVFEPFFTTKPRGQGTGLGLPTVATIVRSRGGRVVVHSVVGEGTTFEVWLPSVGVGEARQATTRPMMATPMDGTVWLAEDDDTLRALFETVLTDFGLDVTAQPNGALGLAEWEDASECASVLLTDLMMPGTGGVELATRLLQKWPELRVLLMSGYRGEDTVTQLSETFPHARIASIEKPFNISSLVRQLSELMRD